LTTTTPCDSFLMGWWQHLHFQSSIMTQSKLTPWWWLLLMLLNLFHLPLLSTTTSVLASKKRHEPTCLPPCKTHSLLVAPCTLWIVKFENSSLIQEWRFVIIFLLKPEAMFVAKKWFDQQPFCLLCDGFVL